MILKKIEIQEGLFKKEYFFDNGFNLISSKGINSVGKTTLLRLIIFALGEAVSMTQGFDPSGLVTRLTVQTDQNITLQLLRDGNTLAVDDGQSVERYVLPQDLAEAKRQIYGTTNRELADNILGAFYIDQDRGWTLLNRGKVTGGIHFSIESFMHGLAGRDCEPQLSRVKQLEAEIKKYEFIIKAAGYQNELVDMPSADELSPDKSRDHDRLIQLRIQAASLKKKISSIRKAQKNNERFVKYITDMGIQVRVGPDEIVKVTPDNLLYFQDNEKYMDGEVIALRAELERVEKQISELEYKLDDGEGLFHVERVDTREFDRQIAGMELDLPAYQRVLESLKSEKKTIENEMKGAFGAGNQVYDLLSKAVDDYCSKLGIEDYFRHDTQGILTGRLKRKSGTKYHQLVFASRLAYAYAVRELCNINLPIIIDSIRGQEMSQENFEKCIKLLIEEFNNHQLIVASIFSEGIPADKIIEIKERVMEGAESVEELLDIDAKSDD